MTPASSIPDVSVVIPTWKAAGFVGDAVASALASTDVALEVVIVDDASPDDTYAAAQALAAADSRIRTARLSVNGGPSLARNRAIDLAAGRYIAVLDADDTIAPNRLAALTRLGDAGAADIVVDNMIEVDENGRRTSPDLFLRSAAFSATRDITLADWVNFNMPMRPGDCLGYLKPLFRRATLDRLGLRYDPALRNSEDYYFVAHLLASGARMAYTPGAGYRYRRSAASTSHRLSPTQTDAWLRAEADFRARHAGRLSAEETAALDARGRALREAYQLVGAIDLLKARRFGSLAGLLASDPAAAPSTLASFARIAVGKTVGRPAFRRG